MSERNGSTSVSTGTAEIPVVRPAQAAPGDAGVAPPVPPGPAVPPTTAPEGESAAQPEGDPAPVVHPTAPVTSRPAPRMPRRGPMTMMGPWAPVAGGLLGLVLGVVGALFLAGAADSFEDRLALVFMVLGLGMLGTSGVLLADEVRMIRQQAREAAVRPQWVETTASLVNGLTPARLLLAASALVLFLAAYVSRG
jgi:hypothetical protein